MPRSYGIGFQSAKQFVMSHPVVADWLKLSLRTLLWCGSSKDKAIRIEIKNTDSEQKDPTLISAAVIDDLLLISRTSVPLL